MSNLPTPPPLTPPAPPSQPVWPESVWPESARPGLEQLRILMRGAGDIASGVALRLHNAGFGRLLLLERANPLAVRRKVAFCEAAHDGEAEVEGVRARRIAGVDECPAVWAGGGIPLLVDPHGQSCAAFAPHVVIEATLAKRNIGVTRADAPLVIGLGPGFVAGEDVHVVIETNRGPDLGRVLRQGAAEPNTGIPATVRGVSFERVLRAPADGVFTACRDIGDLVAAGETLGQVDGEPVTATIAGLVRGLLRSGAEVTRGLKLGDIDPRAPHEPIACDRVSEKALAIGGGVLEAILAWHISPALAGASSQEANHGSERT